ncbi:MAG: hypothetical protein DI562_14915 [Stenotrophomonas acidaminiphila]|nr:MAG: hypothetical protein DI562_14915 [Stenotrophomonas acidaminiphila]
MSTVMRRFLLVCALCCASLAHAQSPADYASAKQRADTDEASLPAAQASAMRDAQGVALEAAIAGCATPTADTSPFVVVAELDTTGKVVRTACRSRSPAAHCPRHRVRRSSPRSN